MRLPKYPILSDLERRPRAHAQAAPWCPPSGPFESLYGSDGHNGRKSFPTGRQWGQDKRRRGLTFQKGGSKGGTMAQNGSKEVWLTKRRGRSWERRANEKRLWEAVAGDPERH